MGEDVAPRQAVQRPWGDWEGKHTVQLAEGLSLELRGGEARGAEGPQVLRSWC